MAKEKINVIMTRCSQNDSKYCNGNVFKNAQLETHAYVQNTNLVVYFLFTTTVFPQCLLVFVSASVRVWRRVLALTFVCVNVSVNV